MRKSIIVISILLIISTLLPIINQQAWWIRIFDFPQLQTIGLVTICLITFGFYFRPEVIYDYFLAGALVLSLCYLGYRILPYTIFYKTEVLSGDYNPQGSISLLSSNVYMKNRQAGPLLEQVRKYEPDLLLLLEPDQWWIDQLKVLSEMYPNQITVPLSNTYGMALYSKVTLRNSEIKYLIDPEIPSIHTEVLLPGKKYMKLHCLHPKPPSPTEEDSATPRDAELLLVAKSVGNNDQPTIVAGDLNDVAWSHTTQLFQNMSGLLDPRIGRGFFNTYHAGNPIFRWPLDHVFHSDDFLLIDIQKLPEIGSDHFPIYVQLLYKEWAESQQDEPRPSAKDVEESNEKIKKGLEEK